MSNTYSVTDSVFYAGVNDHQIDLFEDQYKVPDGMCYNSYVIMDEKTAVMDTVDIHFKDEWLDNLSDILGDRKPDYLIIQHMEMDHAANIRNFLEAYPDTTLVGNRQTFGMMEQFFNDPLTDNRLVVKGGDTLDLGTHQLTFVLAPMVHWPEVMVTYDSADKMLFSADAFGKFGAQDAADQSWDDEARRYYIGIVGKYGRNVQALLKKAGNLDIQKICPLHGPVLTENLSHYLSLYDTWSSYRPEDKGIVIAYTSVYGNTKHAVEELVRQLKDRHVSNIAVYDLARDDMSQAVADAFRYDRLVLATTTYNTGIFPFMHDFLHRLAEHNFQNRTVALIENGSWAPTAAKVMKELLSGCQNISYTDTQITIKSAPDDKNMAELSALADELTRS